MKERKQSWMILFLILNTFFTQQVWATARDKPVGISASLLSQPFPSIFGINFNYRPIPNIITSAGIGVTVFGSSYGITGDYIYSPQSSWSPTLGIGLSRASFVFGQIIDSAFGNKNSSAIDSVTTCTFRAGAEYASGSSFFMWLGVQFLVWQSPSDAIGLKILPGVTIGFGF